MDVQAVPEGGGRQRREVSYVAACALDLAFRGVADEVAIGSLLEACDADAEVLEAAREAASSFHVGDAATRRGAAELLLAAAAAARRLLVEQDPVPGAAAAAAEPSRAGSAELPISPPDEVGDRR